MGSDLDFLIASIEQQSQFLRRQFARSRKGRGAGVIDYFQASFDEQLKNYGQELSLIDRNEPNSRIARANHRTLERFLPDLSTTYGFVGLYLPDVGRQDLPVGILHLVDLLVEELVRDVGDKLIHLDSPRMYSTIPLYSPMFDGRQPIIFNLPALDPANVLWAPILAHEVGHSAVSRHIGTEIDLMKEERGVDQQISALSDDLVKNIVARREREAEEGGDPLTQSELTEMAAEREQRLADWTEELLCDALAARIAGPSFLFALCSFLVASTWTVPESHPHSRTRVSLALEILSETGWSDVLADRYPELMKWVHELIATPPPIPSELTRFLHDATALTIPLIRELAKNYVRKPLVKEQVWERIQQAEKYIGLQIPPIDLEGSPAQPWEIVLAGWLSAFSAQDTSDSTNISAAERLAAAPYDASLNRLLVKSIELSKIVELWHE